MAKAIFGAGCFWGVEASFRKLDGVADVACGYSGGHTQNPTYQEVCRKDTGHAEVVEVIYDPSRVSYDTLLNAFFDMHDPTQVNRQGPDIGSQYRSAIFTLDDDQAQQAQDKIDRLNKSGIYTAPIATELSPAGVFWRAEEYHQRYFERRGVAGCGI